MKTQGSKTQGRNGDQYNGWVLGWRRGEEIEGERESLVNVRSDEKGPFCGTTTMRTKWPGCTAINIASAIRFYLSALFLIRSSPPWGG